MGVFTKSGKGKPAVAGGDSSVDPKKPVYRNASGYMPEENINQGPSGGKKGKVTAFHGQNSDNMGEHDDLVPQTSEQKDPYMARGSDFPVKHVDAKTGQSGMHGFSQGHNELAWYGTNQEGARHTEDDGSGPHGSGTPVSGSRSSVVASNFPIQMNMGESSSDTGEIAIPEMVDLQTGYIVGSSATSPVEYVPESKVSVGKPPKRNMKAGMMHKNY